MVASTWKSLRLRLLWWNVVLWFGSVFLFWQCTSPNEPPPPTTTPSKLQLDPLLRLWLQDSGGVSASQPGQISHRELLRPLLHTQETQEGEQIRLLFRYEGPREVLKAMGIPLQELAPNHFSTWLPSWRTRSFLSLPQLKEVRWSRSLQPHLNISGPLVHAPQARIQHKLDGRGVLIALIDTGIDYEHAAFRHADGTTRILAILDYSLPAKDESKNPSQSNKDKKNEPPRLFSQDDINAALQKRRPLPHRDNTGHGTHIAGIAAGNGNHQLKQSGPYIGIAPHADIVVIKALRKGKNEFESGDILESIAFVHQLARKRKQPYVINLSLGGHHGGHDGTTFLERVINVFSGAEKPGQIIVASAGNEGNLKIHTSGWIAPNDPITELPFILPDFAPEDASQDTRVLLELWYPAGPNLKLSLLTPQGYEVGPFRVTESTPSPAMTPDGTISITHNVRYTPPTSHHATFLLANTAKAPLSPGRWKVRIQGATPRFDAWIVRSKLPEGGASFLHPTSNTLVGVPGAAHGAITVGSFNARNGWQNSLQGSARGPFTTGEFSPFSSPGPTRDGRFKPDLSAPGLYIAAPASRHASFVPGDILSDGPYAISQGTSQAAPHVSAAAALLLQQNPKLTTPMLRGLLLRSTRPDSKTSTKLFHPRWGFGKLHIHAALQTAKQTSTLPPSPTQSTFGSAFSQTPAHPNNEVALVVIPRDRQGRPIQHPHTLQLRTNLGTVTKATRDPITHIYHAKLRSPGHRGTSTVTAWIDSVRLESTVQVRWTAASTQPRPQGCACSLDSRPPNLTSSLLWTFFLFLLAISYKRS